MFNRYETRNVYETGPREVHHHRAPTDESVRLLAEMEKAARDKVIASYSVDNVFKVGLVEFREKPQVDGVELIASFSLNGEQMRVRLSSDVGRLLRCGREEDALREVYRKLAECVADRLFEAAVRRMGE